MLVQNNSPGKRDVFNLAWPMALNAILLQLILIIDTVLVTPLGEESLAAMALAASIGSIVLGILFAFSNGTQLIIAQAYGAKDTQAIATGTSIGLLINLVIAALGLILIFTLSQVLINAIAETVTMAGLAYDYLKIFSFVVIGVAISQNICAYFNAIGNSKIAFYSNLLELPVNVLLSLVLIYGWWGFPELKLVGAALGSAIAVSCRVLFLLGYRYWFLKHGGIEQKPQKFSTKDILHHLKHAAPIAGNFITMVLANSVNMLLYAKLGIFQFAAFALILPWVRVVGHISNAWAQATGIFVGQLLGGPSWNLIDRFVGEAWRVAWVLSFLLSALYFSMFYLYQLIYPELQAETMDTLWSFMPILVILPFIRVSNTMCGNVLRAGGDAMFSFKVHSLTQWLVTVPLTALFVLYLELSAVWVFSLILLEEVIKGIPFHLRIRSGQWRKRVIKTPEDAEKT